MPIQDEPALEVVREILRLHALEKPIGIEVAAAVVRDFAKSEAKAAVNVAARALDQTTEAVRKLEAAGAWSTPPLLTTASPEEIRGRLLGWLHDITTSKHRRFGLERMNGTWEVTLTNRVHDTHTWRVAAVAARLNHLDAITVALDEVGAA